MTKAFSLFALIGALLLGCSPDPLPPLTYTGDNPRIQNPLTPEASQRHIQVPEGFETVLFAAEPDIINPIAFTWDERGRLWVVQSMDYPHGLDNEVGGDRITICEDVDGDGHADKFTDFVTEQRLSTGIVVVQGGAIVAQAPEMVFLEDTDGDDKMDQRTVLFDGFGTWDTHAGPSSLRYGPDNLIWGALGYSGFENQFQGEDINFKMGVFRFTKNGDYFEPVGQFNNNTWGLGITEDFEVFGSTANNNHCCYVGIPLKHYAYLDSLPDWAVNADFIQGHYEISPLDTIPLQQVDVRGGYTAAAGANFYTARNYPQEYWNQMYVNEPTGHLVHIANIETDGAGYKEVDGGNIFASTDAWTAPVFTDTGPDGNLWVADWYNPVIQHNPDSRGMENQVWNDNKGEGNAHINPLRDKGHGRIYIIRYKKSRGEINEIDPDDHEALIEGLRSDNMFWRTTAQRLIVEGGKRELIPRLQHMVESGDEYTAVHALWTLKGLGALSEHSKELENTLLSSSRAQKRAGLALLPDSEAGSALLVNSSLLQDPDLNIRLAAMLCAAQLPETDALYKAMQEAANDPINTSDKWLSAALKVYARELHVQTSDADALKAEVVFTLNAVNQEMAYDQKVLYAAPGQIVEIVLNNKDQMPHNLVVIEPGSLERFGKMVDGFLNDPKAAGMGYVPDSRYVLGSTAMLDPGERGSVKITVPDQPGAYPFLCTFPGHWRLMQGTLIVNAPGTYISENPEATRLSMLAGGGSHDFVNHFGVMDGKILNDGGNATVTYTEQPRQLRAWLEETDVLYLCNNKPIDQETRQAIFSKVERGMGMMINHPSTWYNWKDWPEYNQQLVGGGSESHEQYQEFEVQVVTPNHPIMKGVPSSFRIVDELYRWEQDPEGTDIEVLAMGKSLETGQEFPVIWTVKHPTAKIVCNTLGHDQKAHGLPAYQTVLKNSLQWVKQQVVP